MHLRSETDQIKVTSSRENCQGVEAGGWELEEGFSEELTLMPFLKQESGN